MIAEVKMSFDDDPNEYSDFEREIYEARAAVIDEVLLLIGDEIRHLGINSISKINCLNFIRSKINELKRGKK
jgi:hypothetical protein